MSNILDMRGAGIVGYAERITWSQLIASAAGLVYYLAVVLPPLLQGRPVGEIDWVWPMVWSIVGAIVASIVISIVWGILAGMANPEVEHTADLRDREIEQLGDRVGQAFMVIGGLVALVLAMIEGPWFWIGNAIFLGFFLSAFLGGLTRLAVYHRGMP